MKALGRNQSSIGEGNHCITEYPQMEGTHKDHRVQRMAQKEEQVQCNATWKQAVSIYSAIAPNPPPGTGVVTQPISSSVIAPAPWRPVLWMRADRAQIWAALGFLMYPVTLSAKQSEAELTQPTRFTGFP